LCTVIPLNDHNYGHLHNKQANPDNTSYCTHQHKVTGVQSILEKSKVCQPNVRCIRQHVR